MNSSRLTAVETSETLPDRVHHLHVVQPGIGRSEHRVNDHRDREFRRRLPERIEVGIIERTGVAPVLGPDHRARHAVPDRLAQHPGRKGARLQRHRRQRQHPVAVAALREHALVQEPRPVRAFLGGQLVAEGVEPAAGELQVDARTGEEPLARFEVAQRRHDRPGRRSAGKREPHLVGIVQQRDRRKLARPGRQGIERALGQQVGVDIDDHGCSVAVASRSDSVPARMGRSRQAMPKGASASLTALATAAGAPR